MRITTEAKIAITIFACILLLVAFGIYDKAHSEQKVKNSFAIASWATSEHSTNSRTFTVTKSYDTNASGNYTGTINVGDSVKINVWGYDKVKLQYQVDIMEHSDNNCSVWVDWVWGDNDTSRVMPSFAGMVTGIDSTYDSSFVINSYFIADSTMFMDWIAPRVRVAMHYWNAGGADSALDSYKAVKISKMKARLEDD
jgi:hypothetical protein